MLPVNWHGCMAYNSISYSGKISIRARYFLMEYFLGSLHAALKFMVFVRTSENCCWRSSLSLLGSW